MPAPSSVTRMSRRPPPSVTTSMRGRAGIERVLDQLLDHARRALDHLAGGDAVDDAFGELADGHGVARANWAAAGAYCSRPVGWAKARYSVLMVGKIAAAT